MSCDMSLAMTISKARHETGVHFILMSSLTGPGLN